MLKLIFSFLLFSFNSTYVYASGNTPFYGESDTTMLIFQLLFSLIFVLLIIYFFFWILKKKNKLTNTNLYNHLGGLPLGQNKSVQIVEIGNKIYILGIGEDVRLISIIESDEDIQAIKINQNYQMNTKLNGWIKHKFSKNKMASNKQFEIELAEKMEQLKSKRSESVKDWLNNNEGNGRE